MGLKLRRPVEEIRDEFQSGSLAFFGVELSADHIVPTDCGIDFPAIIDPGQNIVRIIGHEPVGVHEIGMVAIFEAC